MLDAKSALSNGIWQRVIIIHKGDCKLQHNSDYTRLGWHTLEQIEKNITKQKRSKIEQDQMWSIQVHWGYFYS